MTLTDRLLAEIQRDGSTRDSIAEIYREGIKKHMLHFEIVDWPIVNRALLRRYKPSGLNYIKAVAWQQPK